MKQSLGKLPDAPLIYVLAQVVFTRIPKMGSLWEDFHQRVFDVYPESGMEQIDQFAVKPEGVEISKETRWNLVSSDHRKGLILHSNALILHTTSYSTSGDFFADLRFALDGLVQVLPARIEAKRLGLRYVDLLVPRDGLSVDQQVTDALRTPSFEDLGCKVRRTDATVHYETSIAGEMVLRYRQSAGPDVLPGDLFPNALQPAPLLTKPRPSIGVVGLLDFDHFVSRDQPFEVEPITAEFRKLQETTSAAFRAVTTPDAMRAWEGR